MSRTARRLGLAVVGIGFAGLAAFATASPAAADNGPHVMVSGSAVSGASGCAGCHRMHASTSTDAPTGAGSMFRFKSAEIAGAGEETDFCYTCHADGLGATTNVRYGVSTANNGATDTDAMHTGKTTYLNVALRGGGFEQTPMAAGKAVQGNLYFSIGARTPAGEWSPNKYKVDNAALYAYDGTANTGLTAVYPAGNYPVAGMHPDSNGNFVWGNLIPTETVTALNTTTSRHGVYQGATGGDGAGTMWGSAASTGAGASVALACVDCHNPHGNGSYRILRPVGTTGSGASEYATNIFTEWDTVSGVDKSTTANDPYYANKYLETFTVGSTNAKFIIGQPAIFRASGYTVAADSTASGTVYSVSGNQVVIGGLSSYVAGGATTGFLAPAFPTTIVTGDVAPAGTFPAAVPVGSVRVKFTTAATHGLYVGAEITISSAAAFTASGTRGSALTVKLATVESITSSSSFTLVISDPAASITADFGLEKGLYTEGIADAKDVTIVGTDNNNPGISVGAAGAGAGKVYTTSNFYIADDMYYNGTYQKPEGKGTFSPSAYIQNVSQWCSTCHTRYLSTKRQMQDTSNSAYFGTYKHRSDYAGQGSPNCIQCHVAHGTSAVETGWSAKLTAVGSPNYESQTVAMNMTPVTTNSVLLRVDNRGICLMCHNPYGIS